MPSVFKNIDDRKFYIFIAILVALTFLSVNFSLGIGSIYTSMVLISGVIGVFLIQKRAFRFGINSQKGNSIQALGWAVFFWFIFILSFAFVNAALGDAFARTDSFSAFLDEQSAAFLGSTEPALAGNPFLKFFTFGFIIASIETVFLLSILLLVIHSFRDRISKRSVFKSPLYWVIVAALGIGAVYFHIDAKGITGIIPLIGVFMFFSLSAIIPFMKIVSNKPEMEVPIMMHVINNSIAILPAIGFNLARAFGG